MISIVRQLRKNLSFWVNWYLNNPKGNRIFYFFYIFFIGDAKQNFARSLKFSLMISLNDSSK